MAAVAASGSARRGAAYECTALVLFIHSVEVHRMCKENTKLYMNAVRYLNVLGLNLEFVAA